MRHGTETTSHVEVEDLSTDDKVYEVNVDWAFSPFDPGVCSGPPERCYPPEGGETESCVVTLPDGTIVEDGEGWLRKHIGDLGFDSAEESAYGSASHDDPRY
jgi:hypothetical protein